MSKRTIEQRPVPGELLKPVELIELKGAGGLSLHAGKIYNRLLHHAFGPGMADEGRVFTIPVAELRGLHKGNERIADSLRALQTTLVVARLSDGKTRTVQLLGGTDMDDEDRQDGVLSYSFDLKLIPLLRESTVFGKLELRVIWAFASKYALALYEAIARRVRLRYVWSEDLDMASLRELLRVPPGKLERFADLNRKALQPALREVNALASFEVHVRERLQGKRVVGVTIGWAFKDEARRDEAWREVQRSRVGRRARLLGLTEHTVVPVD
jgi:hypothetical protein